MKRLIIVLSCLVLAVNVSAQPRRVEHNVQLGLGVFSYGGDLSQYFGVGHLAGRVSYGADICGSGHWSVMPEIGAKIFWEGIFALGAVGADFDTLFYLDFTLSGRYHTDSGIILGLGPMLSFTWWPDHYYVDANPGESLNRRAKNKPFLVSLRPSISFDVGPRWRLGIEGELGLMNAKVQHMDINRPFFGRLHALRIFAAWHF